MPSPKLTKVEQFLAILEREFPGYTMTAYMSAYCRIIRVNNEHTVVRGVEDTDGFTLEVYSFDRYIKPTKPDDRQLRLV